MHDRKKRGKSFITPEEEVQDIDTPDDWKMAEIKYRCARAKIELT